VTPAPGEVAIGRVFREASGRSVATLIRMFGDIDIAEDAVQDAYAIALRHWARTCLHRDQPGPYQLQAAINAVHADAATLEETDWPQIVALYDQLRAIAPTPVVALNRAVAIGEVQGAGDALAIVDALDLEGYHPFHAARADLLRRLGHHGEAAAAYERAAQLAPTEAEREFLRLGGRAGR